MKVACVQFTASPDLHSNLKTVEALVREAATKGATFIATPENTDFMMSPAARKVDASQAQNEHEGVAFFGNLAKELKVFLLIGSMAVKLSNGKLANRSFLFSAQGAILATYDKIHMFDVDLPTGESHRESETIEPGKQAHVVNVSGVKVGLSICYDLRFASLYRALAKAGASIIAIPAAFTVPTGKAHWEVLLRARAIETGCFILAPAQTGEHDGGRKTWGHSMIVSPWGEILAEGGDKPGVIVADLNLDDVMRARNAIPALTHDRAFEIKS